MASRSTQEADYQPVAGEFDEEKDRAADAPGYAKQAEDIVRQAADATRMPEDRRGQNTLAVHEVLQFPKPAGVYLANDRQRGVYRIMLSPDMDKNAFKALFEESLKPLLIEHHQLNGDGKPGPEVRFYFQPQTRDWEIRYRFVARDDQGEPVKDSNGRNTYDNYHGQVSVIANRVAERIGRMLNERLGVSAKTADAPF